MKYLLIWDIDGTLIQGRGIGRRAMDAAFMDLYGIENGFEKIDMAGRLDSMILKQAYESHSLAGRDSKEYFDRYCIRLKEETKKLDRPIDAPGVLSLLEILADKDNFYNILGTGNVEHAAQIKLDVQKMNKFFPTGGFGDEEMERWQVIEKAVANSKILLGMEFDNRNIYVIGDTPKDIECSKKLNLRSIAVATGSHSVEDLKKCGADYVFENFENSKAFLDVFV